MTVVLKTEDGLKLVPVEEATDVFTRSKLGEEKYYILLNSTGEIVGTFGVDECLGVFRGEHISLDIRLEKKED